MPKREPDESAHFTNSIFYRLGKITGVKTTVAGPAREFPRIPYGLVFSDRVPPGCQVRDLAAERVHHLKPDIREPGKLKIDRGACLKIWQKFVFGWCLLNHQQPVWDSSGFW
jgi:hypothetical protein